MIRLTLAACLLAGTANAETITPLAEAPRGTVTLEDATGSAIHTPAGTFTALDDASGLGLRVHSSLNYHVWDRGPDDGNSGMVDSRWSEGMRWEVPAPAVRFSVLDTFDRPTSAAMQMIAGDATYDFPRGASGNLLSFLVDFEGDERAITFLRTANSGLPACGPLGEGGPATCDGWAVGNIAPIPLPAAGWLLLGAVAAMGAAKRRARG